MPIDGRWVKKMWGFFNAMEYYSAMQKDNPETFVAKWMHFETYF